MAFLDKTSLPQQSVKDFLNQIYKQMRKITWQQAQQIIDEACIMWKRDLSSRWGFSIALKEDIEIKEEFYREMRDACTDAQHKLFDEIFGKDVPECPYKDGEPVWVTNEKNVAWSFRYSTGKINEREEVVCYDAQRKHGATSNWKFHMPFNPNNLPVNE